MATVVIGLINYTLINDAEAVTNWTTFDTLDPDFAKESSNAITGTFRADATEGYYTHGSALTASGKHVRMWINTVNKAYMEPESNGGYEFQMYDGTTTEYRTMFGSDTYDGGWFNMVFDCALFTTLTLANVTRWGIRVQHTGNSKNIDNVWADFIRYLDGYYITGGTNGDEVDLALIAARDVDDGAGTLRGYGIILDVDGVFFATGKLVIGNSTTTTYFKMDGNVLSFVDNPVAENFHEISADGTVADIEILDSTILADGATDNARFVFDMSNTSITLSMTATVLIRAAAVTFASGQTVTGDTFNDCDQITHGGATMNESTVKNYEGTADTSALIYNVNADPDGEMDDMTFVKGTASTHAIEFGTTSPLTMTLRGMVNSGYNASDAQTDSTFYVARTSGTVTINIIGGSGNFTYKSAGATVDIVINPVTVTINVNDRDGVAVSTAQVGIWATADYGSGGYDTADAIMNEDTVAGVATEQFSGTTPVEVEVRVRKASSGATKYKNYSSIQTIGTDGLTLTVTLDEDPNNNATT